MSGWRVAQVQEWVKKVQAEILNQLSPSELTPEYIDEFLIAIQSKLIEDIRGELNISSRIVTEDDFEEIKEKRRQKELDSSTAGGELQEKRFLKFVEAHNQIVENKDAKNLLTPNEHDYVVLEAKELIKYFDDNGLSSRALEDAEAKNKNCRQRPQKSKKDYELFLQDNFDRMASEDFQFSGFKFKGSNLEGTNFSKVEFTQFHDVYYNTGDPAELYDRECKDRKDQLVGMTRETACTFSVVEEPERLKVDRKLRQNEKQRSAAIEEQNSNGDKLLARRTSPRKKPSSSAQHFAKPVSHVSGSGDARRSGPTAGGGGGGGAGVDLSELNRKKLRSCVYECLLRNKIKENNPIFRPCFTKLFGICKMYVVDSQQNDPKQCTKKWMLDICNLHVTAVVGVTKLMKK